MGAVLALGLSGFTSGCQTEVLHGNPISGGMLPDRPKSHVESDLREKTEKDPQDPSGWFSYGMYWEDTRNYMKAIECYERGNELMDGKQWTGGNLFLGRAYAEIDDRIRSFKHLNMVIELESPDPRVACLNNHFAEAHFWRGALYYLSSNWRKARADFLRFLELGGEENRVSDFLDRIDREIR